jgi:hypothetical protein
MMGQRIEALWRCLLRRLGGSKAYVTKVCELLTHIDIGKFIVHPDTCEIGSLW